ncbi:GDSL-type esterase/lipase family protein [Pseudalkalibacillus decolorationis]|uniref:GDSL-type esterase/lipase family protein n=1 Tax=Pseudalkalibacillus decolorationis TaxID=163879 RepID=UPI0021496096|nr:GDSL-type esterase/lipase family protein [Pseudalkalibacillus decolorationis]
MRKQKSILLAIIIIITTIGLVLIFNDPKPTSPVMGPILDEPVQKEKQDSENKSPDESKDDTKEKQEDNNKRAEAEPVPETVIEDIHVVGLGDSLTKGSGDDTEKGYIQPVSQYIRDVTDEDVSLKNFGIHGYPSDKLVKKIETEEVQKHLKEADHIFITIGGNDILNIVEYNFFNLNLDVFDAGLEQYRKNLFIIVQSVRTMNPEANIYLVGLFNPFHNFFQDIDEVDQVIEEWNETIKLVAELNDNTSFIPIEDIFIGEDSKEYFSSDKLHPNQNGYLKMAERIEEYIVLSED